MKNMNPAIKKFKSMLNTFENSNPVSQDDFRKALPIIHYGENLLKMYPHLDDEDDTSEIRGLIRTLRTICTTHHIEITKSI